MIADEWHRPGLPPLAGEYVLPPGAARRDADRHGRTWAVADTTHAPTAAPPPGAVWEGAGVPPVRAFVHVPLVRDGLAQAVFGAAMEGGPRQWAAGDVEFAELVAAEARAAVDAARLLVREQTVARALQDAVLPSPRRDLPGLDVGTFYRAALAEATIGGDFCDVFALGGPAWALVVGDVSGKGLQAAAQIATARNMLRYALYQEKRLDASVAELNAVLTDHRLLTGFVALFVAVYDAAASTLTYVSCGHEPALLRRASGTVDVLPPTGPVLGVIPGAGYARATHSLSPGDALLVYTDGASEAGPDRAHQLGLDGLRRLLEQSAPAAPAAALVDALAAAVKAFAGGTLHDDLCLLAAVRPLCRPARIPAAARTL